LLQAGAVADAAAEDGATPLIVASYFGHVAVVRELLAAHANPSLGDCEGNTPLSCASETGHKVIARLLIDAGASTAGLQEKLSADRERSIANIRRNLHNMLAQP
jgi:ankyrin repeat protein